MFRLDTERREEVELGAALEVFSRGRPLMPKLDLTSSDARFRTKTAESFSERVEMAPISERTCELLSDRVPSPLPRPGSQASIIVLTSLSRLSRTTAFLWPNRCAIPANISGFASDAATDGLRRKSLSSGSSRFESNELILFVLKQLTIARVKVPSTK